MPQVTVSPKFQVVIPQAVRQQSKIQVGQKMEVIAFNNRIELIPIEPMKNLKGIIKGADTTIVREPDRL